MKERVKVSFYLKKNEMNDAGRCPVMTRLSIGKSQSVFSTKTTVPLSLWVSGRVVGKSLAAGEINRQLDEIRVSALSHYGELSAVKENVTAEEVKSLVLGMSFGQDTLLAHFRAHNENFNRRVGVKQQPIRTKTLMPISQSF